MRFTPHKILAGLRHKFLLAPAGRGRPIPAAAADGEYVSGAWSHFDSVHELPRYVMLAGVIADLHPHGTVLDVGCGAGRLEQLLQAHAPARCLGVDFSPAAITRARARNLPRCEFVEGDFTVWRPAEKFDAIVCNEVIGYVDDPGAFVQSLLPFLQPGGHLFLSHFRFGHWRAIWRRVETRLALHEAFTLTNASGQTWDIKVLRPAGPPA
jgi:2-polyprenyl-3-methyl-5-hydroxy-6-metoxy-1,4-benzoquinol methylase